MSIRVTMLTNLLSMRAGWWIAVSHGSQMASQNIPDFSGRIVGIQFVAPDGVETPVAMISAVGIPEGFQVGINLALAPWRIQRDSIVFDDMAGGTITITRQQPPSNPLLT